MKGFSDVPSSTEYVEDFRLFPKLPTISITQEILGVGVSISF